MRVNPIGSFSAMPRYVPSEDRIMASIVRKMSEAIETGKSKVEIVMKDSPAAQKVIQRLEEQHYSVDVESNESDSVKITINL